MQKLEVNVDESGGENRECNEGVTDLDAHVDGGGRDSWCPDS